MRYKFEVIEYGDDSLLCRSFFAFRGNITVLAERLRIDVGTPVRPFRFGNDFPLLRYRVFVAL